MRNGSSERYRDDTKPWKDNKSIKKPAPVLPEYHTWVGHCFIEMATIRRGDHLGGNAAQNRRCRNHYDEDKDHKEYASVKPSPVA